MDVSLPVDKLSIGSQPEDKKCVVLVATGSFNPPTFMHLRMFELARDALRSEGFHVLGGYMSPVNDAYKKEGLLSAEHRLEMCNLACKSSDFIMVDPWEASQDSYQRSLVVLSRVKTFLTNNRLVPMESLKVMLLCGSDLLQSFCTPGVWIPEQVKSICKDYGIVCIRREGQDVENMIFGDRILYETRDNIRIVNNFVPNQISSSRLRQCISRGLSVKYLTEDGVIDYIRQHQLYTELT
ncbi:Nicotinamide/nicotinic acid mononucleotide adenylyltransferase [Raphanus sativus]|uniref:Nicotinamide-nucleotide adenylyltransferase n=1 Tax=Raphanus sativus TaxID=3726 RepID=A0A6J0MLJ5_RAPSA|nr:nicotinamide/nicotinic acid mononucleotide adenylyltransferase [Raphanus sativus]XP_056861585.1 nicotinamide/nicotinic acid mononucleotide adenylyltransferase [Raphanus sativus]KAJ4872669.1 Nicotinamide/nicotinic acid mononucleotide adenylyltransferase [Raphanus sativus]KAJ4907690.1 Nicotinamide/nicotinic acid mononucleotide adenylyltransferase [Raphanus sativus]